MTEVVVQIVNDLGLRARAAARMVHVANGFSASIAVTRGASRVDGKSILGLLTLAASKGTELRLRAEGEDEEEALNALRQLVGDRFGEER